MSKRSTRPAGPITRRHQMAAFKQVKGQEIAAAVSTTIREAVAQEVDTQLKKIKNTMLDMIDRVIDCEAKQNAVLMRRVKDERDGDNRSERTEAMEIQPIIDVVQEPCHDGASSIGQD